MDLEHLYPVNNMIGGGGGGGAIRLNANLPAVKGLI